LNLYLWKEGYEMCKRQNLKNENIEFLISEMGFWPKLGFVVNYFARIVAGIKLGLTVKLANNSSAVIYSASDFWMDSLPCFILKLRYPKVVWVAAWYQTAPEPWIGYTEGSRVNRYSLRAFLYWFVQKPIKPIVSNFADFVLVNNESERKQFSAMDRKGKVIVVLGAVDLEKIESWKLESRNCPKVYAAVFQGRFHPQKGVVELVDIWRKVVDKLPEAKLAMIGDGPLMSEVKRRIAVNKLTKNVKLFGFVFDGDLKYKIFSQSKIVVHPAFYDSGGMASAEAMAFGIPCVGFDLKAYHSYYPKGMIKVPVGDIDSFAKSILDLLKDNQKRTEIGNEAVVMIENNWSWEERSNEILKALNLSN
jgi:glycosyltransferase involved in cell wall biosynthesis